MYFKAFEAFEPKKIKERNFNNFINYFLTKGAEDLEEFHVELLQRSQGFSKQETRLLLKQFDKVQPKNVLEVGALAMLKYFLENYEPKTEATIPTLIQMKSIVNKATKGRFDAQEFTWKQVLEDGPLAFMIEDEESFISDFGFKPEECKFYSFVRDIEDRSALFMVDMIATPKGAFLEMASDRVSIGSDGIVKYEALKNKLSNW